ncbi:hypothetical protein KAW50_05295 [candidate division WOR-3 bacterium]|nr:hypothetical protein [candidate division WOR-3 bacterium]
MIRFRTVVFSITAGSIIFCNSVSGSYGGMILTNEEPKISLEYRYHKRDLELKSIKGDLNLVRHYTTDWWYSFLVAEYSVFKNLQVGFEFMKAAFKKRGKGDYYHFGLALKSNIYTYKDRIRLGLWGNTHNTLSFDKSGGYHWAAEEYNAGLQVGYLTGFKGQTILFYCGPLFSHCVTYYYPEGTSAIYSKYDTPHKFGIFCGTDIKLLNHISLNLEGEFIRYPCGSVAIGYIF